MESPKTTVSMYAFHTKVKGITGKNRAHPRCSIADQYRVEVNVILSKNIFKDEK